MSRRGFIPVFIIFLGLLVLSRHITVAPGAQIEIFRSLVVNEAVEKQIESSQLPLIDPSQQDCGIDSLFMNKQTHFENKSAYKKYISPEKIFNYKSVPELAQSNYQSTSFSQFWLFSTLPQVIHANSPPHLTSPQTHSLNSPLPIGDRDYSYETKSCSDSRGVCINCIRP